MMEHRAVFRGTVNFAVVIGVVTVQRTVVGQRTFQIGLPRFPTA